MKGCRSIAVFVDAGDARNISARHSLVRVRLTFPDAHRAERKPKRATFRMCLPNNRRAKARGAKTCLPNRREQARRAKTCLLNCRAKARGAKTCLPNRRARA